MSKTLSKVSSKLAFFKHFLGSMNTFDAVHLSWIFQFTDLLDIVDAINNSWLRFQFGLSTKPTKKKLLIRPYTQSDDTPKRKPKTNKWPKTNNNAGPCANGHRHSHLFGSVCSRNRHTMKQKKRYWGYRWKRFGDLDWAADFMQWIGKFCPGQQHNHWKEVNKYFPNAHWIVKISITIPNGMHLSE